METKVSLKRSCRGHRDTGLHSRTLCVDHTHPHMPFSTSVLSSLPLTPSLHPPPPSSPHLSLPVEPVEPGQVGIWLLDVLQRLDGRLFTKMVKTSHAQFCHLGMNFSFQPMASGHPHLFCCYFQTSLYVQQVQSPTKPTPQNAFTPVLFQVVTK